jgi:hypothetical protein
MNGSESFKLLESTFSSNDLESIQSFVINKLKVPDLFRLRDRTEGVLFLNNTTKKVPQTIKSI